MFLAGVAGQRLNAPILPMSILRSPVHTDVLSDGIGILTYPDMFPNVPRVAFSGRVVLSAPVWGKRLQSSSYESNLRGATFAGKPWVDPRREAPT